MPSCHTSEREAVYFSFKCWKTLAIVSQCSKWLNNQIEQTGEKRLETKRCVQK